MKVLPENPFRNRNKVTDPEHFCAREEESEIILDEICYEEPQSVAVVGERRIGKSSLLTHIFQRMRDGEWKERVERDTETGKPIYRYVSIFIDPEELVIDDPQELTWVILDELLRVEPDLKNFMQRADLCPSADLEIGGQSKETRQRPEILLNRLLEWACHDEQGYRFVFFIDEFELLADNLRRQDAGNYFQYLRGISDNYHLAYVTASRHSLSKISMDVSPEGSPFDNNFSRSISLGLFREEDHCRALVRTLMGGSYQREGVSLEDDIERVIELAGRHPYYFKCACSHLFEWRARKVAGLGEPREHWEKSFQKAAAEEYGRMWNALTQPERRRIIELQKRQGDGNEVSQEFFPTDDVVASLQDRGVFYVRYVDETPYYRLFSESFHEYVKSQHDKLQERYERLEDRIARGELRWELEDISSRCKELRSLEARLKELGGVSEGTAEKCSHLREILEAARDFIDVLDRADRPDLADNEQNDLGHIATKALHRLISYFSSKYYSWYRREPALRCRTAIALMEGLQDHLDYSDRPERFANGYDEFLKSRFQFLRAHKWWKVDKANYRTVFDHAFNRLVRSQDFRRAEEMLRPEMGGVFGRLKDVFINCPIGTTVFLVLAPFMLAWLFQGNGVQDKLHLSALPQPVQNYLPLLVFVGWHLALVYEVVYSCFFRKVEGLDDNGFAEEGGKKYYRRILFPGGLRATLASYGGGVALFLILAQFLKGDESALACVGLSLSGVVLLLLIYTKILKQECKLPSYSIAYKRSQYLCSIQFLQAMWVGIFLSVFLVDNLVGKEVIEASRTSMIAFGHGGHFIHVPLLLLFSTCLLSSSLFRLWQEMYIEPTGRRGAKSTGASCAEAVE